MSYFLNRLKEQASSIQSMAKNIIVYDNTKGDQNNDDDDQDEEVLDQIIHDEDEQIGGQVSGSGKAGSAPVVKEQAAADDFFNSFIPSLQQKVKVSSNNINNANLNSDNVG